MLWARGACSFEECRRKGQAPFPHSTPSTRLPDRAGPATELDHAQGVAALAARVAGQFVHERPHQEDAAAADTQLGRVEMGHGIQVERLALVEDTDLDAVGAERALDFEFGLGPAVV